MIAHQKRQNKLRSKFWLKHVTPYRDNMGAPREASRCRIRCHLQIESISSS